MDLRREIDRFYYKVTLAELQLMNSGQGLEFSYNSYLYLCVIDHMQGCTVGQLARALHVTPSAVTIKVNELVKQGYVVKRKGEADKRSVVLTLSDRVTGLFHVYERMNDEAAELLQARYSEEQQHMFCEMLDYISGYMGGQEDA